MERLRKGLSIIAAAALLAPASGALAGRLAFKHHEHDHERDDDMGKAAKSSAGDLTLRSRALLGKDGKTQLEISTAPFDTDGTPPGNITHVHVRAVDPDRKGEDDDDKDGKDGKEFRFRREYNHLRGGGYFTNPDPYTGLPHGLNLRVEAKARGVTRRDEVEAKWLDAIRYRPDLYIKLIDAPASARINSVVTINAIVAEGMGETGADTNVALLVDGNQVDETKPVWVKAADATTVTFLYSFPVAGLHQITVVAKDVRPGDYDDSNNASAPQTILITQPFFSHYDAAASETTTINNSTVDLYLLASSPTPDSHVVKNNTTVVQLRSFDGVLPAGVNPETNMQVTFSDNGGSAFDVSGLTLDGPLATELPGCSTTRSISDADAATGRTLTVFRCSNLTTGDSTTVSIKYAATQTNAFSQNFCKVAGLNGCKVGDFTTTTVTDVGAQVPMPDNYSASVQVSDGATVFTAKPALPLTPFVLRALQTNTNCGTFNSRGKRCTITTGGISGKSGKVSVDNAE